MVITTKTLDDEKRWIDQPATSATNQVNQMVPVMFVGSSFKKNWTKVTTIDAKRTMEMIVNMLSKVGELFRITEASFQEPIRCNLLKE